MLKATLATTLRSDIAFSWLRDCTAPQMAREDEQASRRLPVVPNDFAHEVRYDLVDSSRAGSGGA
jgi:hypothetical protein